MVRLVGDSGAKFGFVSSTLKLLTAACLAPLAAPLQWFSVLPGRRLLLRIQLSRFEALCLLIEAGGGIGIVPTQLYAGTAAPCGGRCGYRANPKQFASAAFQFVRGIPTRRRRA